MTRRTTRLSIAAATLVLAGTLGACQAGDPIEQEAPVASGELVLAGGANVQP